MKVEQVVLYTKTDTPNAGLTTIRSSHQDGRRIEFTYDFMPNLASMIVAFGEETVYAYAKAGMAKCLRDDVYEVFHSRNGKNTVPEPSEKLPEFLASWQPGVKRSGPSIVDELRKLPEAERKAKIHELLGMVEDSATAE